MRTRSCRRAKAARRPTTTAVSAMEVEEGEGADDDRKNAVRAARAVPAPSRAVPAPFPRRSLVPPAP
eukprot:6378527-Prymnesium_polylepis.1